MKNISMKIAAVAFAMLIPAAAFAGKGGSNAKLVAAVNTGSVDAIIAEAERMESLLCEECIQTMTNLTEDSRYAVREVAAWWFARRPALKDMLAQQFADDLPRGDTTKVRNAADFLGATKTYTALPQLRATIHRSDLGVEARVALVRAAAVAAWPDVLDQQNALPVVALLGASDANVRAQAAAVVGGMTEQSGRLALEGLVTGDASAIVRRNAAWALGQLGNAASRAALLQATSDKSGLVRGVAKAALAQLR